MKYLSFYTFSDNILDKIDRSFSGMKNLLNISLSTSLNSIGSIPLRGMTKLKKYYATNCLDGDDVDYLDDLDSIESFYSYSGYIKRNNPSGDYSVLFSKPNLRVFSKTYQENATGNINLLSDKPLTTLYINSCIKMTGSGEIAVSGSTQTITSLLLYGNPLIISDYTGMTFPKIGRFYPDTGDVINIEQLFMSPDFYMFYSYDSNNPNMTGDIGNLVDYPHHDNKKIIIAAQGPNVEFDLHKFVTYTNHPMFYHRFQFRYGNFTSGTSADFILCSSSSINNGIDDHLDLSYSNISGSFSDFKVITAKSLSLQSCHSLTGDPYHLFTDLSHQDRMTWVLSYNYFSIQQLSDIVTTVFSNLDHFILPHSSQVNVQFKDDYYCPLLQEISTPPAAQLMWM
jgi:hypothetical protein